MLVFLHDIEEVSDSTRAILPNSPPDFAAMQANVLQGSFAKLATEYDDASITTDAIIIFRIVITLFWIDRI